MKRARHPPDVMTQSRTAEMAVAKVLRRLNGWANVVMTVAGIIDFVRDIIATDLPQMARELLRRVGMDYRDDDDLSIDGFQAVLSRQTGIEFNDITSAQQIRDDIEAHVLNRIEEATGFRFSVLSAATIRAELIGAIEQRVTAHAGGTASDPIELIAHTLPGRIVRAAREAKRHGFTDSLGASMSHRLQTWNHREAERRYEAWCSVNWRFEDMVTRKPVYGRIKNVALARQVASMYSYNKRYIWGPLSRGEELPPFATLRFVNRSDNVGIDWRFAVEVQQKYLTLTEANKARIRAGLRPLRRTDWDRRRFNGNPNIRGNQ